MIILNLNKINTNFTNFLTFYENLDNYGSLHCPFCHSTSLIRWGSYERNVILFDDSNCLIYHVLKVQRVRCKSCHKTHALLPLGIIPYKQFSSNTVTTLLSKTTSTSIASLSEQYMIDHNIILNWLYDFKTKHYSKLVALLHSTDLSHLLSTIHHNISVQQKYLLHFNMCFMQIKKSIIGLCPS